MKSGFIACAFTEPSYIWYNPETDIRYSRYQTQKHKLKTLLENFIPDFTENENMELNGFIKLYNTGNLKLSI